MLAFPDVRVAFPRSCTPIRRLHPNRWRGFPTSLHPARLLSVRPPRLCSAPVRHPSLLLRQIRTWLREASPVVHTSAVFLLAFVCPWVPAPSVRAYHAFLRGFDQAYFARPCSAIEFCAVFGAAPVVAGHFNLLVLPRRREEWLRKSTTANARHMRDVEGHPHAVIRSAGSSTS